jgi:hypothetical protein
MAPQLAYSSTADLLLRLLMPGCLLDEANPAADDYFYTQTGKHLSELSKEELKVCLCKILVGPHAYLAQYCPLEMAFQHPHEPTQLYALRYRDTGDVRNYELFLVHTAIEPDGRLGVRLLRFPSAIRLYITNLPGTDRLTDIRKIAPTPLGIRVSAPPLFDEDTFSLSRLAADGKLDDLENAARFYDEVLTWLRRKHAPSDAWHRAVDKYTLIETRIPEAVAQLFRSDDPKQSPAAIEEILGLWEHALDAPVLMQYVFPAIRKALDEDTTFRFASTRCSEDRDRYFRLHIPVHELVQQELYTGWLPMARPYREERAAVRDELARG